MLDGLLRDLRFAGRIIARNRAFSVWAIVTLALGIAGSASIFSVVNGALLTPWPYRSYDRIVTVQGNFPTLGRQGLPVFSAPEVEDLRGQSQVFEHVLAGVQRNLNFSDGGEPERVRGAALTASAFAMLGVPPLLGRVFGPEDDRPGGPAVVVLGYRFWRNRLGGDPGVVGRALDLEGVHHIVLGVMPRDFVFWDRDLYLPLRLDPNGAGRTAREFYVQATLRAGIDIERAEAALRVFARREQDAYPGVPEYRGWSIALRPLVEEVLRDARAALYLLLGAVLLLLAVACANVASMMLVQATRRRTEMAIRAALGAQARDVARQVLVECLAIAGIAGALGVSLSVWAVGAITSLIPYGYIPAEAHVRVDLATILFAIALSFAVGFAVGIVPGLRVARTDLFGVLRAGAATSATAAQRRTRNAFLVAQIALAVVVLSGAALMLNSFRRIASTWRGFQTANVMTMRLALSSNRHQASGEALRFYEEVTRRMRALPQASGAALATSLPVGEGRSAVVEAEDAAPETSTALDADLDAVTPAFFSTLEIPLLEGRAFTDEDVDGRQSVAIVNRALATHMWPQADPIGRRLRMGGVFLTVAGVVGDVRRESLLAPPRPAVYIPLAQARPAPRSLLLAVKTTGQPAGILPAVKREVRTLDSELPIVLPRTLDDAVSDLNGPQRLATVLLTLFAALALLLAVTGIYATISHSVALRRSEIGIRMALGATARDILRAVMGEGVAVLLRGLLAGFAISIAAAQVLSRFLYRVSPTDPATLAVTGAVVSAAALLASYLPARRACATDAATVLR